MRTFYDLGSVLDDRLLADLTALVATDCRTQAKLLAHIGEVEQRRLYCAHGYSSMHGYCTGELHLSEAAAYKRITAARAARRVPAIYDEQQLMKRKFAATDKPRTELGDMESTAGSRHLPAALKRAVLERVGIQCAWTSADGKRCAERGGLEFHHIVPYGKGGPPTVDNITLLSRAHNQYQGVLDYGAQAMRPRAGRAREPSAAYGRRPFRATASIGFHA